MTRYLAAAVAIVLLILVTIFSFQNLGIVDVKFLTLSVSLPIFVVVIATYVLGMITGGSVAAIVRMARKPKAAESKPKGGK